MDLLSVSTRLAGSGPSVERGVRWLLDLGFDRIVLHPDFRLPDWEAVQSFLPRQSVGAAFLFTPRPTLGSLGPAVAPPSLGSLDTDERREALKNARESVVFADRWEIRILIVPPLLLEEPGREESRKVLQENLTPPAEKRAWKRMRTVRATSPAVPRQLDSLLGTLYRLLDLADRYGIRVAMVPAGFPCEQPNLTELERCFEEFSGAPFGVFADTLRLERAFRSEEPGAADLLSSVEARLVGVLVHDGDGLRENLPLGSGEVQLDRWKELQESAETARIWALDLREGTDEEALLASRKCLENLPSHGHAAGEERPKSPTSFLDFS